MEIKEIIQVVAFGVSLLFVLRLLRGIIWLLNSPSATTGDAITLLKNAVVPWWTGLAQVAPLLFVLIIAILVWADADGALG